MATSTKTKRTVEIDNREIDRMLVYLRSMPNLDQIKKDITLLQLALSKLRKSRGEPRKRLADKLNKFVSTVSKPLATLKNDFSWIQKLCLDVDRRENAVNYEKTHVLVTNIVDKKPYKLVLVPNPVPHDTHWSSWPSAHFGRNIFKNPHPQMPNQFMSVYKGLEANDQEYVFIVNITHDKEKAPLRLKALGLTGNLFNRGHVVKPEASFKLSSDHTYTIELLKAKYWIPVCFIKANVR